MNDTKMTKKKVYINVIIIFLLFTMLTITTYALIASLVSVDDNTFVTAKVAIEINGGEVIFDGSDFNVEPGMALKRDFTIENKSTVEVYYRLYLENVDGALKDSLKFEIYDGNKKIFSSSAANFQKSNPCISNKALGIGETHLLTAVVTMDKPADNRFQDKSVSFDMTADAVQSRNNPDKMFD